VHEGPAAMLAGEVRISVKRRCRSTRRTLVQVKMVCRTETGGGGGGGEEVDCSPFGKIQSWKFTYPSRGGARGQ